MAEDKKPRKPRKMLTKPVEQAFRQDMAAAIEANAFALNTDANQSADDIITAIKAGIKDGTYQPGITFTDYYVSLGGVAEALPGGEAQPTTGPDAAAEPQGAIAAAQDEVSVNLDPAAQYLAVIKKAKARIAEFKSYQEEAENQLKALLGDKTQGVITGDDGKPVVAVTYDWVNATRFDKEKLEADNPGIVERYTTPSPHRRFRLT